MLSFRLAVYLIFRKAPARKKQSEDGKGEMLSVNKTLKCILVGIGGLALTMVILCGGRYLIRGIPFEAGFKDFWNWTISAMSGFSCGYACKINDDKKK